MRDYLLLIFALTLFIPIFIVGHLIHLIKGASMKRYAYNIALHLDEAGGAMLFNSEDHTISAMAYKKEMFWFVDIIDWIFRDGEHCYKAWKDEFDKGSVK